MELGIGNISLGSSKILGKSLTPCKTNLAFWGGAADFSTGVVDNLVTGGTDAKLINANCIYSNGAVGTFGNSNTKYTYFDTTTNSYSIKLEFIHLHESSAGMFFSNTYTSGIKGISVYTTNTKLVFRLIEAATTNDLYVSVPITTTNYYDAFITYDGSKTANGVKFYFSGVEQTKDAPVSDTLSQTTFASGNTATTFFANRTAASTYLNSLKSNVIRIAAWTGVQSTSITTQGTIFDYVFQTGDGNVFYDRTTSNFITTTNISHTLTSYKHYNLFKGFDKWRNSSTSAYMYVTKKEDGTKVKGQGDAISGYTWVSSNPYVASGHNLAESKLAYVDNNGNNFEFSDPTTHTGYLRNIFCKKLYDGNSVYIGYDKLLYYKTEVVLLFILGDSISGGLGLNSSATVNETRETQKVGFFNRASLALDTLRIANPNSNNLTGHTGLSGQGVDHGWELEFGNLAESGYFYNKSLFLLKGGQGGSVIANWLDESQYSGVWCYATFLTQVNALKTVFGGTLPANSWFIISQGTNDAIAGTSPSTWKTKMISFFNNLRTDIGQYNVILPYIKDNGAAYASINTKITELGSELSYVSTIPTTGVTYRDSFNPDYAGNKVQVGYMKSIIKAGLVDNDGITGSCFNKTIKYVDESLILTDEGRLLTDNGEYLLNS